MKKTTTKELVYIGLTQIIQDNLFILRLAE